MKFLRYRTMEISSLVLPGNWKTRLAAPHVRDLAESLAQVPLLHAPCVTDKREVIAGADRLAALSLRGDTEAVVAVYDATPLEVRRARIEENLRRRHDDRDALRAELVELVTPAATPAPTGKPGRPRSTRAAAIATVAKVEGVTTATVRRAVAEPAVVEATVPAPSIDDFETWGDELTDAMVAFISETRASIDAVVAKLQAAQATITAQKDRVSETVFASLRFALIHAQIQQAAGQLRAWRPVALCPYCKGQPEIVARCPGCRGLAMVGQEAVDRAPEELKKPDGAVYQTANAKPAKKLTVEIVEAEEY